MSKSYTQLMKQIESLKNEAERLRKQEIGDVVARIREAVVFYGLTAADLGLAGGPAKGPVAAKGKPGRKPKVVVSSGAERTLKALKAPKGAEADAAVKFRNEAGQVWGGRGPRPRWLREALAGGAKLEDFQVKS